jgi:hypothetical protein
MRGIIFKAKTTLVILPLSRVKNYEERLNLGHINLLALVYISYRISYEIFYQYKCNAVFIFL